MNQIIKTPTRYSSKKNSCLDLFFTNSDISNSLVCDVNLSDHELTIVTNTQIKIKTEEIAFKGRSYVNYDNDIFYHRLSECNWVEFDNMENPADMWNHLILSINNILNIMCLL